MTSLAGSQQGVPKRDEPLSLDVVVPVYNEAEAIDLLFERLREVFSPAACERNRIRRVRFRVVDDGSTDASAERVARHIQAGAPASLVRLSRNFGHQAAVSAGLDHADADVVAIMDADLQDPPEELLAMLSVWRQGHDVVYGQRANRKEGWPLRAAYSIFYRVLGYLSEGRVPRDSGDFCLFGRRVHQALRELPERLRFVRGLRAWVGFRQVAHLYERGARSRGRSKYGFRGLYMLATDGIASASIRPLQVAQFFTIGFFVLAAATGTYALWGMLGGESGAAEQRLNLLLVVTSFLGFCITFCLYVLSAYVARMYLEVKGRPGYLVMEVIEPPTSGEKDAG